MEMFMVLKQFELLFLAWVIIYGLPIGFANTARKMYCVLTGKKLNQSSLGRILDGTFWFSIIVLIVLNLK